MRRPLPTLMLLALLAPACCQLTNLSLTPAHTRELATLSLVKINSIQEKGLSTCGGFVVDSSRGEVMTAAHCVGEPTLVDGELALVKSKNEHLAILIVGHPIDKPQVVFSPKTAKVGDVLVSVGYGYGEYSSVTRAVSLLKEDHVYLDGGLIQGMSGGPVVNLNNEVVTINQADTSDYMGVGCPASEMVELIRTTHEAGQK